jgi:hypothetical protein
MVEPYSFFRCKGCGTNLILPRNFICNFEKNLQLAIFPSQKVTLFFQLELQEKYFLCLVLLTRNPIRLGKVQITLS